MFYRIHVTLLRNALLFEIGLARLDAVHNSFYVGSQTFAWSFSAERCNDHKQVSFECMSRKKGSSGFQNHKHQYQWGAYAKYMT